VFAFDPIATRALQSAFDVSYSIGCVLMESSVSSSNGLVEISTTLWNVSERLACKKVGDQALIRNFFRGSTNSCCRFVRLEI